MVYFIAIWEDRNLLKITRAEAALTWSLEGAWEYPWECPEAAEVGGGGQDQYFSDD